MIFELDRRLHEALLATGNSAGLEWFEAQSARVAEDGMSRLAVVFPALARRIGVQLLPARHDGSDAVSIADDLAVDLRAWRLCDVAGAVLIDRAPVDDAALVDLFLHGDFEERTITMRQLALIEARAATTQLLGEAQRTNTQTHFEACVCDSNLVARAVGQFGFTADDANKILLKAAFVDVSLSRFFAVLQHASEELSVMVTGLATEREAAGRSIWVDTHRVVAHSPIEGSRERIARYLEHSDPEQRIAAADAVGILAEPELRSLATACLEREPNEKVRAALARATES